MDDLGALREHHALIMAAFAALIAAVVCSIGGRHRWAIITLTAGTLLLRLFAAFLDPFLNYWDEVFHAVVARNLAEHPLTPMLYTEPALPLSTEWSRNHIWLHKPPFFLWQMAASIKLFGAHAWAVRLPSVLWTTALVPATARMGQLLVNAHAGFCAAVLVAFSFALQELTAGALNTDHNDAVFIALVGCSWWALLEWWERPAWKWAVLTGLFSACAVLTKWYVGGIVFLPWVLMVAQAGMKRQHIAQFTLGLLCMAAPVVAWLLCINIRFPAEAAHEWAFKSAHFSYPMDGHRGPWTYHLDHLPDLVPPFTAWVLLPAIVWLAWKSLQKAHSIFVLSTVLALHGFFAIAQTRMPCYTLVLLPIYFIAIAHGTWSFGGWLIVEPYRPIMVVCATALLAWNTLDPFQTSERHSLLKADGSEWPGRAQQIGAQHAIKTLASTLEDPSRHVVFNVPSGHHMQFMFVHGFQTMDILPTPADVDRLRSKGYEVLVLQDGLPMDSLPNGTRMIPDSVVLFPRLVRL